MVATCLLVGKDIPAKVIDVEVITNHCDACSKAKAKIKNAEDFDKWKNEHQPVCVKNHDGSAGMMESVGMKRIFSRSEALHGLEFSGDGDFKRFSHIVASQPSIYNDTEIKKAAAMSRKEWGNVSWI